MSSIQDLSAFAMPLFDPDSSGDANGHGMLDVDGSDGKSGGTGIKGWFRKRQKSGDVEARSSARPLPSPQQQQLPSPVQATKMKHLLDTFRPRSRSDVAAMNVARTHVKTKSGLAIPSLNGGQTIQSSTSSPLAKKATDPSSLDERSLNGTPIIQKSRHTSGSDKLSSTPTRGHIGPEEFLEMYRERAYSDPRRVKEAALAARNKLKRVGICILHNEMMS